MELQLKNIQGEVVRDVELPEALFGVPFNAGLVHQAMVMYQLNRRQGTASTKVRSEVAGGGRKPWRQKHTGRARHGSIRSPIWRGGGVTFGPKPRSFRRDMPKRMRNLALRCVLSQKARDLHVVLIDSFQELEGRTKNMAQTLKRLEVGGSALIVTREPERNVVQSAHNLPKVWTLPVNQLNAQELLKRQTLVITLDAVLRAQELWAVGVKSSADTTVEEVTAETVAAVDENGSEALEAVGTVDVIDAGEPVAEAEPVAVDDVAEEEGEEAGETVAEAEPVAVDDVAEEEGEEAGETVAEAEPVAVDGVAGEDAVEAGETVAEAEPVAVDDVAEEEGEEAGETVAEAEPVVVDGVAGEEGEEAGETVAEAEPVATDEVAEAEPVATDEVAEEEAEEAGETVAEAEATEDEAENAEEKEA